VHVTCTTLYSTSSLVSSTWLDTWGPWDVDTRKLFRLRLLTSYFHGGKYGSILRVWPTAQRLSIIPHRQSVRCLLLWSPPLSLVHQFAYTISSFKIKIFTDTIPLIILWSDQSQIYAHKKETQLSVTHVHVWLIDDYMSTGTIIYLITSYIDRCHINLPCMTNWRLYEYWDNYLSHHIVYWPLPYEFAKPLVWQLMWLRPCLVSRKFCKNFQISCHIEFLDTCIKH
jgi:hypothetical protein